MFIYNVYSQRLPCVFRVIIILINFLFKYNFLFHFGIWEFCYLLVYYDKYFIYLL